MPITIFTLFTPTAAFPILLSKISYRFNSVSSIIPVFAHLSTTRSQLIASISQRRYRLAFVPPRSMDPETDPDTRTSTGENKSEAEQKSTRHPAAEGLSEWKKRAPYRIHEKNENFLVRYEAECHCGKVKYQLSREEPLDSKLCHCTTCQIQHAAPFQWAAIFHKEDINFVHGHHDLEWYDPSSKSIEHKLPCKVRCAYCHSPIMDEGRNMILLFPSLVHLETPEARAFFKPRCHIFYSQRAMDVPDGLPKWTGLDRKSDLIEDSPPQLVKEIERNKERERKERFEKGENM